MELFDYQKKGVEWLKSKTGAILADEMGLGKTAQAIVALGQISESTNVIVCPASCQIGWKREINRIYTDDEVFIFGVDGVKIPDGVAWVIVNYTILSRFVLDILKNCNNFSLVGDEAHYIKNASKRTEAFLKLAKRADRVYLLTGSPMINRPIDLYNLLRAVKHKIVRDDSDKENWFNFACRYAGAFRQKLANSRSFLNVNGARNLEELKRRTEDVFLRRTKNQVLNLPPKIRQNVLLDLTEHDKEVYKNAFGNYLKFLKENPINDGKIDNVLMAKHLVEISKCKQVASDSKIKFVVDDIESAVYSGQKIIVFSQFLSSIAKIKSCLDNRMIGNVVLVGEDSIEDRQNKIDIFQKDENCKVFVGSLKSSGVGITLTASSNVFFLDLDWSPATHEQGEDRAHRFGQKGTVNVRYYIAKGTIDEYIMEMLESKKNLINVVFGDKKESKVINVKDLIEKLLTGHLFINNK